MMREPNIPEHAHKVIIDVGMEVYLKNRPDAINYVGTFMFNRDHLNEDDVLESFMSIVTRTLRSVMDDRTETMFVLSDALSNKFIIKTDDIQAMTVMAPTPIRILAALEESENYDES